ncbi:hypothetical protein SLEP1_g25929 [Rubroshorea leprosula]|uniref:Uncharacterized protein n=1 Tax=Rubroshorea leprosula TaxID=152421 RepID=A0AAV5JUX2_9ROSI|nr:hypothetical protein SLEP1_g25929 [Rubroshorea leprosula]
MRLFCASWNWGVRKCWKSFPFCLFLVLKIWDEQIPVSSKVYEKGVLFCFFLHGI